MDWTEVLERQFSRMGARLRIGNPPNWQIRRVARDGSVESERNIVRVDVLRDSEGEYFDLRMTSGVTAEAVDVQPKSRHLVLLVRDGRSKPKFLCGHDERHWFTAAVPGDSVRSVETAIAALKPVNVRDSFIRQGEWFFTPETVNDAGLFIHRKEPLSRGAGSKPHICEELIRSGGTPIWMNRRYPTGITETEYEALRQKASHDGTLGEFDKQNWQRMVRDAMVHARGYVRHSDHKTIWLPGWHRVHMNNERFAPHAVQVAFLD